jgi:hypothetical protein
MESWMSGAVVIEAALFSFLLALWMTWLGLRGLFLMMPARPHSARPARFEASGTETNQRRHAA